MDEPLINPNPVVHERRARKARVSSSSRCGCADLPSTAAHSASRLVRQLLQPLRGLSHLKDRRRRCCLLLAAASAGAAAAGAGRPRAD